MKLSDYVIDFLVSNDVAYVFEVCGGAIAHLLDSLHGKREISAISMHHEQAAAMAAEGFARIRQDIGVAMATSGPGATNMITGIASCFFDSIPCLFITGQVNTYEFKFNKPIRQLGFQETDIVNIVKPIVKDATLVKNPKMIRYYLERAIYMAKSGRPGPVLLDIPMDVQRAEINPKTLPHYQNNFTGRPKVGLSSNKLNRVVKIINSSLRPVVLAGGGLRSAKSEVELLKFINKTGIPVVTSLMGLDAFPHNHPAFSGMLGTYGNRYANLTVANADFLLVLGTRLDTRQTGTNPATFARMAKVVYVDIDPHELKNNRIKAGLLINSDLKEFLAALNRRITHYDKNKINRWKKAIRQYKERYPSYKEPVKDSIQPNFFMHKLSEFLPEDALVCADVGQNQMWAAQSLEIKKSQRFLTQGGMGAMGSSLPMAIGASFAHPDKTVVVIVGDGGFQLNIQELETVYHHKLPIKIILLNNRCYGMVRQFQEQYFNSKFQSTIIGYSCPDFQDVVSAYKIPVNKIRASWEIITALKGLFKNKHPMFLEVNIEPRIQVMPKLAVNKPIEEQEPVLSHDELKSNMFIEILSQD